jgi:HD superfamily phosphohydrolase
MERLLPDPAGSLADSGVYDYAEPFKSESVNAETRLIRAIAASKPFRRLEDIRFLGALDYCLVTHPNGTQSNARFTRAQHSIGVAALSRAYLELVPHSERDRLVCIAAAMLHDIGHSPFSHTLEPIFKEAFGIDHHQASQEIIFGQAISNEIPQILTSFSVDPQDVVNVLNGNDAHYEHFFSGPINFDTIEGILRSRYYLKMQNLGITPLKVVQAATIRGTSRSRDIADAFWHSKDEMYTLVIRSKLGVLFDALFQAAARHSIELFRRSDFYLTEVQAFKKFPILRDATQRRHWATMSRNLLPDEISYHVRRFYIDEAGDFFNREDAVRYRQSKKLSSLTLKDVVPA